MMRRLRWEDIHLFLEEIEAEYLGEDAVLAFPKSSDATAFFSYFHLENDHLVVHARLHTSTTTEQEAFRLHEEPSTALCYPAITWQQIIDVLQDTRQRASKAYYRPVGIGFPPDFHEENFISEIQFNEEHLIAIALYERL